MRASNSLALVALLTVACRRTPASPVPGPFEQARIEQARVDARMLYNSVMLARTERPDACPTVEQLIADGVIDRAHARRDPWGQPYQIECGATITAFSPGPDHLAHTADDVAYSSR